MRMPHQAQRRLALYQIEFSLCGHFCRDGDMVPGALAARIYASLQRIIVRGLAPAVFFCNDPSYKNQGALLPVPEYGPKILNEILLPQLYESL